MGAANCSITSFASILTTRRSIRIRVGDGLESRGTPNGGGAII